jgi:hypothetical protein
MPGRQLCAPIKGSLGAGGVRMVVGRGMVRKGRFTGPVIKALVGIAPAWIQDREPGDRCEVHTFDTLDQTAHCPQDREPNT